MYEYFKSIKVFRHQKILVLWKFEKEVREIDDVSESNERIGNKRDLVITRIFCSISALAALIATWVLVR